MDITEIFNKFITGELENQGIGIAFAPSFATLSTYKTQYVGFFTQHTHSFFEPYVETTYDETIEDALKSLDKVTVVPMVLGFSTLWLGTTVMIIIAIINRSLEVPKMCLLLNPIPSTVILLLLKKLKVRIIGALGVGFMMFAILLMIAGIIMG